MRPTPNDLLTSLLRSLGATLLAACSATEIETDSPVGPRDVPTVHFHVEPDGVSSLSADDTLRFRAISDSGTQVIVHWEALPSYGPGTISETGRFHACAGSGFDTMTVRAVLQSDPTQIATSRVYIRRAGPGVPFIDFIRSVPSQIDVRSDSLHGIIAIGIPISRHGLACVKIGTALVELLIGGTWTTLAEASYDPPSEFGFRQVFEWDTRSVPNGDYTMRVMLLGPGTNSYGGFLLSFVRIRNP